MSQPKWTDEQLAAITLRGQLLVAAAAGSGKTAVLVERLIRRIMDTEDPVDVDRFLVVTFTKAAANEMRERIGKALDEALFREQDVGDVERLLHQRVLLQRASITTLHSFCLELIRKYFYQLELDPAFRIADAAEAELLRQDVIEELFESRYALEDRAFLNLVDAFGTDRDDQPLMEHVLRLYEFAYSQVHPATWLNQLTHAYVWDDEEDFAQSVWGQTVRLGILDRVLESLNELERAEQIARRPGGPTQYALTLQDDENRIRLLKRALEEGSWGDVEAHFKTAVDFPRLPAVRTKAQKQSKVVDLSEEQPHRTDGDVEFQKQLQEECKKCRDEAKKKLGALKDDVFVYPIELQLPALREMGKMAQTFAELVQELAERYTAAKGRRNVLDFTDLEHLALRLLEEEGTASALAQSQQAYYVEVLVDEYQDINPVQERILQCVSRQEGNPNLFMVGDVKQSIYRFRMADPSLFLAKYSQLQHWHPELPQDQSPSELVIDLNRNFRSRREVVDGVNFLFRQIMTEGAGEIPYDDQAALQYGASFVTGKEQIRTAEGPIEVHLYDPKVLNGTRPAADEEGRSLLAAAAQSTERTISGAEAQAVAEETRPTETPPTEMNGTSLEGNTSLIDETDDVLSQEELEKARIEARLVSNRIQQMVQGNEFQIFDKELNDFRWVRYSDIVVLMRSYSAVAPIYVEEFQDVGIPVYAETTTGYFGASEVEIILSLLKVIDNPRLDIPLAAVLRSPLVGLDGSELGKIRALLPEGDFYEALTLAVWAGGEEDLGETQIIEIKQILKHKETIWVKQLEQARRTLMTTPGLKEKITDFWVKLQIWRTRSRRTSLAELLWTLYEETGYLAYVGTLPAGVQRQANLRVLYDRASRFEATRYRGLFRFLHFLERFQGQGKDMGNARALGENENVVRLITVHASKGLEFPVVFVVGLGRPFNIRSLTGKLLLHAKLGMGMPIIDVDNRVRYPSLVQYAVKQRLAQEALAEELRILYVALTRAKERLFLYGHIDHYENTRLKWQRVLERESVALSDGQLRSAKNFLDWIGPALVRHPKQLFDHWESQSEGESVSKGESESAEIRIDIPEITSQWQVHFHQSLPLSSIPLNVQSEGAGVETREMTDLTPSQEDDVSEAEAIEHWYLEVDQRLRWQYPHLNAVREVAKTSVSELKRQYVWYHDQETVLNHRPDTSSDVHRDIRSDTHLTLPKRPKFLQEAKPLTAAERGTALHTVMQHVPYKTWASIWPTLTSIEQTHAVIAFLSELEQREILRSVQRCSIEPSQLVHFLNTPLGERLFQAEHILREIPFTLTFPFEAQTPILVQGVIDAVIICQNDNGERHAEVLDYKTDALKALQNANPQQDAEQALRERYGFQLALYAQAIERLLKMEVSRCTLYAFALGREVTISTVLREAMLSHWIQQRSDVGNEGSVI